MADRRLLVVGCGFIGLPFARLARAAGWRVFAATRQRERFAGLQADGLTPVQWDVMGDAAFLVRMNAEPPKSLRDAGAWLAEWRERRNDMLPSVDAVVYSVGFDRSAGGSIHDAYSGGLATTMAALPGSPKVVYASSTGVYVDADGRWVNEETDPAPSDQSASACLMAERTLQVMAAQQGRLSCVLRLAGLYGPGRLISAEALKRGEPIPGDGDAWLNLVHRDDAALALLKAVEHGANGEIYNIADGSPVQRRNFYETLAQLLDAPRPTFAPQLARRRRGNRRIDAAKARAALGWSPRYPSYVEGLTASIRE